MNNENLVVLLQSILEDVTALRMAQKIDVSSENLTRKENEQLNLILTELTSIKDLLGASNQAPYAIDQQRVIDLKIQIDRISARLAREDSLWRYYFSPGVLIWTLLFSLGLILTGVVASKAYQIYWTTTIETQSYEDNGR